MFTRRLTTRRLITLMAILASLAIAPAAYAASVWTPPTDISTQTAQNEFPMIDVTPSGESVVAVKEDLGGGTSGFRVSLHSPGGSFAGQVLPPGGSALVTPDAQAAVDLAANGEGIVAWQQSNGLFYALRSPDGAFGAPQQVTGVSTTGLRSVGVAIDDSGNATFLWTTTTGSPGSETSAVYTVVRRADGVFVNDQTLASIPVNGFEFQVESLDVNSAGTAVATWRQAGPGIGDVRYAVRDGALALFSAPVTVSNAFGIDGAVDAAGDIAVAMSTGNGLSVRSKQAGAGWSPATENGDANGRPDLALAGDGTATVVWQAVQGPDDAVMTCNFTTAGCLKPPEALASDPTAIADEHVAVTSSGAAVVLWSADPFGASTIRARARSADGTWGPELTAGPLGSSWGDVGIDSSGDAVGAWYFKTGHTQVASLDVVAPVLGTVDVPARATAGTPITVAATDSDNIGPVALSWNFGDGTTASGGSAGHTYTSAGTRSVTVTATDASGNTTSQTHTVTVDPAPTSGHGGGGAALAFTTGPRTSNRRFRVGGVRTTLTGRAAAARKRVKVGTVFSYGLNRAATVAITIRAVRGHLKPMTLTRSSRAGANRIPFSGRVGKRALRPGRYRATFIARAASGAPSKRVTITFTVLKR